MAPRVLTLLRRVLSFKVIIEAMIEVALWCAIPYITIGVVWTFFHPDLVRQIEKPSAELIASRR